MPQHILVTGGAGYIGGATVRLLLENDFQVTILDDLSRGHRDAVPSAARLLIGNIADAAVLNELFSASPIHAVMHFAAFAEVAESMQNPALYFRNNSAATLTVLEACLRHKVMRFVFSSSCAVFGVPEVVPISEDARKLPVNPYGQSKLQTEIMLEWFREIHGLRYAVLRYFNAAGAWNGHYERHDPESHLIPNVLRAALGSSGSLRIFGTDYPTPDGTCIRDYVHIYDIAQAHLFVLRALENSDRCIYNVGNGIGFSIREVIAAARRVTGREVPFVESTRRPGDPPILVASSGKIRAELNWSPRYSTLDEILSSALH
jgi:UDP-glucose 4-epimerase